MRKKMSRRRLRWLARLTGGAYALLLGWLAVAAFDPSILDVAPRWLSFLADPGSWVAMTIIIAVGIGALLFAFGARLLESMSPPVMATVWAASSAIVLALASYWRCAGDAPAGWQALSSTLVLFLGNLDSPFGPGQACAHAMPLALHVARIAALTATLTSVGSVIVLMSRAQFDRFALLRAQSVTVALGVDDSSAGVLEALAQQSSRSYRTVLLTKDMDRDCVRRVRAAGTLVLPVDIDDLEELRALRLWRKADRAFLLSADSSANQRRADSLRGLLETAADRHHTAAGSRLPLVVREDDPWLADEWRRRGVGDTHFAIDALSTYEETADALVALLLEPMRHLRHVIVVGAGPLALALLAELSQRGRELQFVGEGAALPEVTLVDAAASEYVDDHRERQRRFVFDPLVVSAVDDYPALEPVERRIRAMQAQDAGAGCLAVVVDLEDSRLGTRLALRYRDILVLERRSGEGSRISTPLFANLSQFSMALSDPSGKAEDCWERAAQSVHARYKQLYPGAPLAVAWEELPREFYRQSNRRQVRTALDSVKSIGRTWQLTTPEDRRCDERAMASEHPEERIRAGRELFDLSAEDLEHLARLEHRSWLRHYRKDGWRRGNRNDDERVKTHPNLVEWEHLDPQAQDKTRAGVIDTLFQLRALGYRSEPQKTESAPDSWRRFRRYGEVTAQRLTTERVWQTSSGAVMRGEPGDWIITDPHGGVRTVKSGSFESSYQQVSGNRWERTGSVRARPALRGEVVQTQEGVDTATDDHWLLEDADGHRWLVRDDVFQKSYRPEGR